MRASLRPFGSSNYRIWVSGIFVSNIGTWFQRVAQDWLVLTELTHRSATSVGIVMALQTAPSVLLLPASGYAADHFDRRRILMATQATQGLLALILALLTLLGLVQLWHVFALALLLGCVSAFDAPARHAFVSELVGDADLARAASLNSTAFNLGRMIGPGLAGAVIAAAGTGTAFLINAISFGAVLASLTLLRVEQLHPVEHGCSDRSGPFSGFQYVWARRDLRAAMLMVFLIGTFGLNFPIFISTMSVTVFGGGASRYGLLMSAMAIGSIGGALLAGRNPSPSLRSMLIGAIGFGIAFALASAAPHVVLFGLALVPLGAASVWFTTVNSSFAQLATEPRMRGRVLAIRLALGTGGTPLGAPVVGFIADSLGPRWAGVVGAVSGLAAACVALRAGAARDRPERPNL